MEYEVIYIEYELKSFKWCNGYYFILEETDKEYKMCRLINGKPELLEKGKYSISCTGKGNKGITRTNLVYKENGKK